MPEPRARTSLATQIARVDRTKFNDVVSDGFYPCAPPVGRGTARVFSVNEIVALTVFGRLLEEGVSARQAGPAACGLADLLREHPEADRAVHVVTSISSPMWLIPEHLSADTTHLSGLEIVSTREWRLATMRRRVLAEIEDFDAIKGDED